MLIKNALKRLQKEGFRISHGQWCGVVYPETVYATKQGLKSYIVFHVSSGGFGENAIASDFRVYDFKVGRKAVKNLSQAIDCAMLEARKVLKERSGELCL